jgi:hypothetical protein
MPAWSTAAETGASSALAAAGAATAAIPPHPIFNNSLRRIDHPFDSKGTIFVTFGACCLVITCNFAVTF